MSATISNFESVMAQLRPRLSEYLIAKGVHVNKGKNFSCINPDHNDSSPSCGIVPSSNGEIFHCFSCLASGNIFHAAYLLEGKPTSGIGFIYENLKYLADQLGVEVNMEDPTADELREMEIYRAYRDASRIIELSIPSVRVEKKLAEYGWTKETLLSLSVGTVESYEDFMHKMTKLNGWEESFLKEVDLHRKSMFSPDNIIYTVKDEKGSPVGFACRNLLYESQLEEYETKKEKLVEKNKSVDHLIRPTKYINSMERGSADAPIRNSIYQKSKRLFGLNRATKLTPPLYIFEGYPDCTTAVNEGLNTSVAIGSTSFTRNHLELILNLGIKHIVFVLDADEAGEEGTDRFIKLLEECVGGHIGLRAEIIAMPTGTDDPDSFIRKNGMKAFKNLAKTDIFGWSLARAVKEGEDPTSLAERMVPLIVNEQSNFIRLRKAKQLTIASGVPEDVIWREITRLVDSELSAIEEEKTLIARDISKQLQTDPTNALTIIQEGQNRIEKTLGRKNSYSVTNTVNYLTEIQNAQESHVKKIGLVTKWDLFDKWINGIPEAEAFVSIPGKQNQGKSSFISNLAWRILENNDDAMVLYHTVDDSMATFLPRFWGSKFNLHSNFFKYAGYYLQNSNTFPEEYQKAMQWTNDLVQSERFVPDDVTTLPPSLPALELRLKTLRQKFPNRKIVVMGDNFHLYDLPGYQEGENMIRKMSSFLKKLTTTYSCTIIMTMELPKSSLRAGVRPRARNIKGSSGMAYDSSLNMGVYNDIKDFGDKAKIVNTILGAKDPITGEIPYRKPVIELVFDKSKINSFDGVIYYELEPTTGRFDECVEHGSTNSQESYRKLAAESNANIEHEVVYGGSAPHHGM